MRLHIAAGMIKSASHIADPSLLGYVSSIAPGSFTFKGKTGNPEPRYYLDPKTNTSRNSIGLENQGINHFRQKDLPVMADLFAKTDCGLFPSLAPMTSGELYSMCVRLDAHSDQIDGIEINAACPNHYHEGKQSPVLAHDPSAVEKLLAEAFEFSGRKRLKIAPNTSDEVLVALLDLCEKYNIETIVSGNTLSESSTVDGIQRLSMPTGGMAGAGLLDIAVEQFVRLKALNDHRSVPRSLIACGGVMNPYGIKRYQEVGATDVALATYFWEFGVKGVQELLIAL